MMDLIKKRSKIILAVVFVLLAAVQLWIPIQTIGQAEEVLQKGKLYKFEIVPCEPTDLLRGKYVTLRFEQLRFEPFTEEVKKGEPLHVQLKEGEDGYAKIDWVSRSKANREESLHQDGIQDDFVIAEAARSNMSWNKQKKPSNVNIKFPFNRFYMEESIAKPAEDSLRKWIREDKIEAAYATVRIKDGKAVLEDVLVDGQNFSEWIRSIKVEEEEM